MHQSYHTSKAYHGGYRASQWAEVVDRHLCGGSLYHFGVVLAGVAVLAAALVASADHGSFPSSDDGRDGLIRRQFEGGVHHGVSNGVFLVRIGGEG